MPLAIMASLPHIAFLAIGEPRKRLVQTGAVGQAFLDAQAESAILEMEALDSELIPSALQDMDLIMENLSGAEKREMLQNLIHQAVVYLDRVEAEMHDGGAVHRLLSRGRTQKRRNPWS